MQPIYPVRKKNNASQSQQPRLSNEDLPLSVIMERVQETHGTLTPIIFMKVFVRHWRKIIGWRFFRMMFLSAAWSISVFYVLLRFPIEMAWWIIEDSLWLPLVLFGKAPKNTRPAELQTQLRVYLEHSTRESIKNSRWIAEYDHGKYANCNCWGCRFAKAGIRKRLVKYYLKAYCFRCRKKVSIQSPQQVIFANGREAISGTCHTCGTTVVRIGRFYGKNLFEKRDL